ncbi:MAG: DUF4836 family protein [Chitinophagaceae bacterium]
MKHIKLISLVGLICLLIISCSKKSNLGKMIPKEAAVVIELNSKSLLSKLSWEDIKKSYWYNQLMLDSSMPATSKVFINDPAKTGIDLQSNMIFFVLKPDSRGQAVVLGSLKDSKAFSEFLKNMHPAATISKDGELNIFKTDSAVIGWNNERFALVTNSDVQKFQGIDSLTDSTITAIPLPLPSSDSLVIVCKNIFSLSEDNSLYKNERFADLLGEEGDIHFWLNTNELSKSSMPPMTGMAGMVKLDKFLVDNISTATINFQDGKIAGTHKQYFGKELSDILQKGDGNINTDMIKRLPSQNLAGVFSIHITPGSLLEIIKLTGLDGFVNLFLSGQGLSLDDVVKATKGDILFAVSDITMKNDSLKLPGLKDTISDYYQKTDATFLFAVAVGDKDAFNKLLSFGKSMGKDATPTKSYQKMDDKYFVLSNTQDAVNKYFSGQQANPDFLSKINNHPMGSFIDVQMILKAMQSQLTKDSIGKAYYDRNIAMWNNFYATGGEFKNGGLVSNGELNLMDKNTNSLKQLNQYADDISKVVIEEKKKNKGGWHTEINTLPTDSATVITNKTRAQTRK